MNIVSRDLFARYRTAEDFAGADPDELMEIIKPCGFYKNKAKNIQGLCRGVLERFGGELPGTMDELLTPARRGPQDGESRARNRL